MAENAVTQALAELIDAVEDHERYWPRVDWGSERCERRILLAIDRGKRALAERAIGDGQSNDSPSTDTQAIGPDNDRPG